MVMKCPNRAKPCGARHIDEKKMKRTIRKFANREHGKAGEELLAGCHSSHLRQQVSMHFAVNVLQFVNGVAIFKATVVA